MSTQPPPVGQIILVGAGPGDPELITLAGVRALASADLVVYDRLLDPALLEHAPPQARRLYLGKEPGENHHQTQVRIHEAMIEAARAGQTVVRLKGGDPFIFGRGGEELQAAARAGIAVRVIPGVSAGLAAAAGAGIPLTHRTLAGSVAFATGCAADPRRGGVPVPAELPTPTSGPEGEAAAPPPAARVDWQALARGADTLVIYMGAARFAAIARELLAAGRPAGEPVAIVRRASWSDQEVATATLGELGAAEHPVLRPPAVVIVGRVVALRAECAALLEQASQMLMRKS